MVINNTRAIDSADAAGSAAIRTTTVEDLTSTSSRTAEAALETADADAEVRAAVRGQGAMLLLLGAAHFVFSSILDPTWGAVLFFVGLLAIAFPVRGMLIIFGLMLMLVGVMNILGGSGSFRFFGLMQIYWGIQDLRRFGNS